MVKRASQALEESMEILEYLGLILDKKLPERKQKL